MSNFMKIRQVEDQLLRAHRQIDRQTDMTQITVAFRNSVNARNYLIR